MLAALIIVPALGACALALVPARRERGVRAVAGATAGATLALAFLAVLAVRPGPTTEAHFLVQRATWIPALGAEWYVGIDGFRAAVILLVALCGLAAVLSDRVPSRARLAAILVVMAGLLGVLVSLDLLLLVTLWTVAVLAVGTVENTGRRLLAPTLAGAALLVLAAVVIRHRAGTLDLTILIAARPFRDAPVQGMIVLVLIVAGFAAPAGVVPLHRGLVRALARAPAPVAALVAGGMTRVAALGMFLALAVVPAAAGRAAPVLMAIGIAGILAGSLRLGWRESPRETAADLAPLHGGLTLLAIAVVAAAGGMGAATGLLLLLVGQGLASALIILVADAVEARGTAPRGLLRSAPVLGALVVLASLASLGVPGTPGYAGCVLVLTGAAGLSSAILVLASAGWALGTAGLLRSTWRLVRGDPEAAGRDLDGDEAVPLFLLAAATVLIGLVPGIVLLRAVGPIVRLVAGLAGGG